MYSSDVRAEVKSAVAAAEPLPLDGNAAAACASAAAAAIVDWSFSAASGFVDEPPANRADCMEAAVDEAELVVVFRPNSSPGFW
jgi:hypothetical protein